MSRLEELQKAVYETGDDADAAWATYDADADDADAYAAADAAEDACYKAMQELRDYKKESGL